MEQRPVIFDYHSIADFVSAMLAWARTTNSQFSLREVSAREGASHSQISRLASGQRRLTRDFVEPLSKILKLSSEERSYLDRWTKEERRRANKSSEPSQNLKSLNLQEQGWRPSNHLLQDWLNVYIRDAAKLHAFSLDPQKLYTLLNRVAKPERIQRSLNFLIREGYLRKTLKQKIVVNETMVATSDGIPNSKIRAFHKQALAIARRNIDLLPLDRRLEKAMILHLDEKDILELRNLLHDFHARLLQFAEERPNGKEKLCQVVINLTQISSSMEDKK